ncbi:phosphatase PAP2 family protein [Lactobacillus sp.]|uniref:phosphatase PAP2 family protein n=1 Tax=Lactobacillus sp. TaxID=1591 RepID=UPI003EFA4369
MSKSSKYGAITGLTIFLLVAVSLVLKLDWLRDLDVQAQAGIASLIEPKRTAFIEAVSPVVTSALALLLAGWTFLKDKLTAIWMGAVFFLGNFYALILKFLFQRPRPSQHILADTGYSFPSGHSLCTFLLVMLVLAYLWPKIKNPEWRLIALAIGISFIALIMFTRLYLGCHYLSDVVASAGLGSGWFSAMLPFKPKKGERLRTRIV